MKQLGEKALHALYSIRRHLNLHNLNPKLAIKIFDTIILPILLYNSEVWGAYIKNDFNNWDNSQSYQSKLGLTIENSEYDRIHRVGRRGSKNRQMIVKFKSYRTKAEVIKHRRKLKGTIGLFINKDLTAYNLDLYHQARGVPFIAATWSSDGKVFVKLPDESIHIVRCKEDIQKLQKDQVDVNSYED